MKNLKLYDSFLWMDFNCLKATEPLQGDSLKFKVLVFLPLSPQEFLVPI